MLALLGELMETTSEPFHCDYTFAWTVMWDGVVTGETGRPPPANCADQVNIDSLVLDELKLNPRQYQQIVLHARLKQMALREAGRTGVGVDDAQTRRQLQKLRESHELYSRAQLEDWIEQNDWNPDRLQQALEHKQQFETVVDKLAMTDDQTLLDELRLEGNYAALKARAEARYRVDVSALADAEIRPPQLLAWYFESQLGETIPIDLDAYLVKSGFHSRNDFYRLLQKSYLTTLAIESE